MRKLISVLAILTLLGTPVFADDVDISYDAMNKAIVTQVKYETLETYRTDEIKGLKKEIGFLKFETFIKDVLIVALAIVKITN